MPNSSTAKKMPPAAPALEVLPGAKDSQDFRRQMGHISRQSSVFFAGTIFTAAAGYLFKIYLARVLGAEALGVYALGMTVVGLAGVVAAFGIPESAARFVASYSATAQMGKLRGFLWHSLTILAILNLLAGTGLILVRHWIATKLYHTPELARFMHFFIIIMFVGAFTAFFGQTLAAYRDVTRRTIITNLIGTPLTMILAIGLLATGFGLWGYLVAQVASGFVVVGLLAWTVWRLTPVEARFSVAPLPHLEREVISFATVLLGVQALEFVLAQTDRVALGIYMNARQVGIYFLAATLTAFIPIVLQSVNQIFAPTIAELHARGNHELLRRLYQTLTKWVLGLTIPLAFTVMVFARPLMGIFSAEFASGWPVLIIGTAGQLVNCGVGSVGLLLLMSGQQSRVIRVQMYVAAATVAANFLLIPVWGLVGAAIASAVANIMVNLLYLREVHKTLALLPSKKGYIFLIWPSSAALAMTVFLRIAMRGLHIQAVAIAVTLLSAYAGFLLAAIAVGLDLDDKLIVDAVWGRVLSLRKGRGT
jgi:O-antigen/teichoic acid export membrane protein